MPSGRAPSGSGLGVAHLDCGREFRGGQNQALLLMRALKKRGVRNILLAPPGPLLERAAFQKATRPPTWKPKESP